MTVADLFFSALIHNYLHCALLSVSVIRVWHTSANRTIEMCLCWPSPRQTRSHVNQECSSARDGERNAKRTKKKKERNMLVKVVQHLKLRVSSKTHQTFIWKLYRPNPRPCAGTIHKYSMYGYLARTLFFSRRDQPHTVITYATFPPV